ncbi:hypothetical protein EBZ39_12095, partial [bacterium]|nr:hypothetical protein [bacterium]
ATTQSLTIKRNYRMLTLSPATKSELVRYCYALILAQYVFLYWIKVEQMGGGALVGLGAINVNLPLATTANAESAVRGYYLRGDGSKLSDARNVVNTRGSDFQTFWNGIPLVDRNQIEAGRPWVPQVVRAVTEGV